MSDDIIDMGADPFDDVVETGDFDEANESNDSEDSGAIGDDSGSDEQIDLEDDSSESGEDEGLESFEAEESEEEQPQEDEESEKSDDEPESEEPEEGQDDEGGSVDLAKAIEEGSLEIAIDEETSVTLKDLKNDYIGQKEISRRFSELDVKNKQMEQDVSEINEYINTFAGKLRDGDSVGAMAYFGEFAGVPPYMIKEQLIAALRPEIIRREQMTTQQLQNEYLTEQNNYLQEQRESEQQRRQKEQANMELQNSIKELRETHNISEDVYNQVKSELQQDLPEGMELTPELVVKAVEYDRNYEQAERVLSSVADNLENAEQWMDELIEVKEKYPQFTDEDLAQVLQTAMDQVKKSSAEQKLAKKVEQKVQPKKTQPKPNSEETADPDLEDWFL